MKRVFVSISVILLIGLVFGTVISKKPLNVGLIPHSNHTPQVASKDVTDYFLDENFDGIELMEIPDGWITIDGDGDDNAWFAYDWVFRSEPYAISSFYNVDGCDDWLITPQIPVEDGFVLDCWYVSYSASWLETMEILVSTTSADPSDFTDTILYHEEIPAEWQHSIIYLTDYVGQDIYIAFHNIGVDRYLLGVDDVKIGAMPDYDGAVNAVDTLNFYYDPDDLYTPGAIVYNMGALPITADVTCYVIHGADTVSSETLIAEDVPFEGSLGLTFSPVALDIAEAVYTIAFEVYHAEDATASNNHSECYAYTYTTPATALFQEFTATWCTWCSYPAVALHQIKNELGDTVAIASYHIWGEGDDPYWIGAQGDELCDAYDISGIPSTACNGSFYIIGGSTGDIDDEYDMYMSVYDYIAGGVRTPVILDTYIPTADASGLDVEVIVQIVAEMQGDVDLRLHYLIIETNIFYPWEGAFPLDSLFDVVRAMLPTAQGVEVTEEEFLDEQHFDIDPSWNTDNLALITFVQDGTNGYVYYAVEQEIEISGIAEKAIRPGTFDLTCNPNPFNAAAEIAFSIPDDGMVELTVYDLNGRSMKTLAHENREAGIYTTIWNGDSDSGEALPAGMYLVKLEQGEMTRTQKIALIK